MAGLGDRSGSSQVQRRGKDVSIEVGYLGGIYYNRSKENLLTNEKDRYRQVHVP